MLGISRPPLSWRRHTAALAPAAVIGAALVAIAQPAAAAVPAAGGVYQLSVTTSGKCIDIPAASTVDGTKLQQWSCTAGAAWQQFRIVSAGSNRFTIANVNSGRCIDIPSGATTTGLQLQQWGCGDGQKANQLWTFTPSGTGTYQIISATTGLCISDQGASTTNGTAIIQETCTTNSNKQWLFTPVGNGRTWSNVADGFASTGGGTTGGAAGTTVTVTNQADLARFAGSADPVVIRVSGSITIDPFGTEIKVASNKTIIGVGATGEIVHGGFNLGTGTHNVIIRNLTIRDTQVASDDPDDKVFDYDGIQMDTADHVWIDHNTIERMNDGLIDSRIDTSFLTVSWNVLASDNKAFGIGWTDNVTARMTIHHNWIHDNNQRNPSTDNVAMAHLYNNYMQNLTSYGNLSRGSTRMLIENSYYDHVNNPYYIDTSAAELRQTGSILVSCTGKQTAAGAAFTPGSFYPYTLDPAADVPTILRTFAGPQPNIGT
ncbi:MAG: pectate lyase [Mycobacteriales bacterium]|jgi:pectate lyase